MKVSLTIFRSPDRARFIRELAPVHEGFSVGPDSVATDLVTVDADEWKVAQRQLEAAFRGLTIVARTLAEKGRLGDEMFAPPEVRPALDLLGRRPIRGNARFDILPTSSGAFATEVETIPGGVLDEDRWLAPFRSHFDELPLHWGSNTTMLEGLVPPGAGEPAAVLRHPRETHYLSAEPGLWVELLRRRGYGEVDELTAAAPGGYGRYAVLRQLYWDPNVAEHFQLGPDDLERLPLLSSPGFALLGTKGMQAVVFANLGLLEPATREAFAAVFAETIWAHTLTHERICAERGGWVLKKSIGTWADGTINSQFATDAEWAAATEAALRAPPGTWVLQRRLELPRAELVRGAEGEFDAFNHDLCPHVAWADDRMEFGGMLVRFSKRPLLYAGGHSEAIAPAAIRLSR